LQKEHFTPLCRSTANKDILLCGHAVQNAFSMLLNALAVSWMKRNSG
jgi:hypothetical protein